MKKTFWALLIALFLAAVPFVSASQPYFSPALQDKNVNAGETLYYNIDAIDPDSNHTLTFSEDSPKFDIDPSTGIINWTPTSADAGTFNISITISDGTNSATASFKLHVNRKPILAPFPELQINEDTANSSLDLDNYIIEQDNDTISWSFAGNSHIAVSINADNQVTFAPESDWNGKEDITLTASDTYSQVSQKLNLTVLPVSDAPAYTSIPTQHTDNDHSIDLDLGEYFYDGDGNSLTFYVSKQPSHATVSISGSIATIEPESDWTGEDSFRITASDGILNTTADISMVIGPSLCRDGIIGDLIVKIKDPDSKESFYIGDTINVEAEVENNYSHSLYVRFEAILYNIDEDNEIKSVSYSSKKKINKGESKDFSLDLEVPTSEAIEEDDTYYLYVKAYEDGGERDHCYYESSEVELKREEHNVIVEELSISPSDELRCGDSFSITARAKNLGENDEEDSYFELRSPKLGIKEYSPTFVINSYDSSKNTYTKTFEAEIPKETEGGDYWIGATVYYNDGKDFEEKTAKVTVTCEKGGSSGASTSNKVTTAATLRPTSETVTVKAGRKTFAVPIIIINNGTTILNPTIKISGIEMWAKLTGLEEPKSVMPSREAHAYAYFVVKEGVAAGMHDLTVEILSGEKVVSSVLISVNLEGGTIAAELEPQEKLDIVSSITTNKKVFWAALDILLIIFAIWLIKVLFGR